MAPLFWERPPEVNETKFQTVFTTESKSVAEFRVRLNISDIWVKWSLLTEYEQLAEIYQTLKFWAENYHNWCIPPTITHTPVINTRGESLSVFYSTDHESPDPYIISIEEIAHCDFSPNNHKRGLQLSTKDAIGSFLDRLKTSIDIYTLTRLLTPSENVVLF